MHVHHLALALPLCLSVGCVHSELGMEHLLLSESVSWGRMMKAAHEAVLEGSVPFALGSAWKEEYAGSISTTSQMLIATFERL